MEYFQADSTRTSERAFQGHNEREVFGRWCGYTGHIAATDWIVDMEQPLARLAFNLLEPRSPDGVANWNFVDASLAARPSQYPIRRLPASSASAPCTPRR